MEAYFLKSQKGGELLAYSGYIFHKNRTDIVLKSIHWRCEQYTKMRCLARAITIGTDIVSITGEHSHLPDKAKIETLHITNMAKNMAATTNDTPKDILAIATRNIRPSVAGKLPSKQLMTRTLQRVRTTKKKDPPNPLDRMELIIPLNYQKTSKGELFLKFDSGPGIEERILIFSTDKNLQLLGESSHWYCDGTFKTVPTLFEQLYTIHGIHYNNVIPAVFCLMPNRREETYIEFFRQLLTLQPNLNPESIMTDFETAAMSAIRRSFPGTRQRGCFFHFSQAIWRKINSIPTLRENYCGDDTDYPLNVRHLLSLAFVPVDQVVAAYETLLDSDFFVDNSVDLQELLDYFESNFIGQYERNHRRRYPRYDLAFWNCYDAVIHGLPKTTNAVEGWHLKFLNVVKQYHPTIWKFIEALQSEQSGNEVAIEQHIAGTPPPPSRKKYRDLAQKIAGIVNDYENRNIFDYLRGLARCTEFKK